MIKWQVAPENEWGIEQISYRNTDMAYGYGAGWYWLLHVSGSHILGVISRCHDEATMIEEFLRVQYNVRNGGVHYD